jgi:hypothetical protein
MESIEAKLSAAETALAAQTAENARLRGLLDGLIKSIKSAHESMFTQCLSNPIKNTWGKEVDVSLLNQASCDADSAAAALGKEQG